MAKGYAEEIVGLEVTHDSGADGLIVGASPRTPPGAFVVLFADGIISEQYAHCLSVETTPLPTYLARRSIQIANAKVWQGILRAFVDSGFESTLSEKEQRFGIVDGEVIDSFG